MGGYGYADNLMTFGWVVKMWGSNANQTTDCGLANYITGYVTMLQTPIASTSALCKTNILWIYNTIVLVSNPRSELILDLVEDWVWGAAAQNVENSGSQPYFSIVGAVNGYQSFGLGNWWAGAWVLDMNGTEVSITSDGDTGNAENLHFTSQSTGAGNTIASAVTTFVGVAAGTNGCYTAVDIGWPAAEATDYIVAGITASSQDCLTYAIDGFVITGSILMYSFVALTTYLLTAADTCFTVGRKPGCYQGGGQYDSTAAAFPAIDS